MPENRDPRKDPRPGDVIQMRPGWTRKIISNDGTYVRFFASHDGVLEDQAYTARTARWGAALAYIGAEVLHVAES